MDTFKTPITRLARLFLKSRDAWKAKALDKQRRLRAAQVKIRDLEASRAYWKDRALAARDDSAAEGEGESPETVERLVRVPPPGHHHSLLVMQLTLRMYLEAGLGSRGVPHVLSLLTPWLPVSVPAHTTVLNWVYRCGLAILQSSPERREDWIFVADHTLGLGASKCLVILGIPASRLVKTGYSPDHHAMQVLAVEVTTHSTGAWVASILRNVAERTGPPMQIVADHGSDLHKGITLFQQEQASRASAYKFSTKHNLSAVVIVPGSLAALLGHALLGGLLFQQIHAKVTDRGQNRWSMAFADAAGVFA
ncbi:hypothetical protein, partial [Thiocystis violacea]|uniref:hypothetical protein n=1 Tax=Thiocystis violacea TaxID=13725 RepID=UPI0019060C28